MPLIFEGGIPSLSYPPIESTILPHIFDLFGLLYDIYTAIMPIKHGIVSYSNIINIIYRYYLLLQ